MSAGISIGSLFMGGITAAAVEAADVFQGIPRYAGKRVGRGNAEGAFPFRRGGKLRRLHGHVGQFARVAVNVAGNGVVLKKNDVHGATSVTARIGAAQLCRTSCMVYRRPGFCEPIQRAALRAPLAKFSREWA